MKLAYCSDLHLEFGKVTLHNKKGADLLVLAGDVCVAQEMMTTKQHQQRYLKFFHDVSTKFEHVLYVLGNHEHYGSVVSDTANIIKQHIGHLPNIHVLDNDSIILNGVKFIGTTLWTSLNNRDPNVVMNVTSMMNDYVQIWYHNPSLVAKFPIRADNVINMHSLNTTFLKQEMENSTCDKVVVITHHAPNVKSLPEKYEDMYTQYAYFDDMSSKLDLTKVHTWIHGHTHRRSEYMVNTTRVLCNPRGYHGYEPMATTFKLTYVTI